METLDDILKEMRDAAYLAPSATKHNGHLLTNPQLDDQCQSWLTYYADRIELVIRNMSYYYQDALVRQGEVLAETAAQNVRLRAENARLKLALEKATVAMCNYCRSTPEAKGLPCLNGCETLLLAKAAMEGAAE